uniref:TonB-dependent receptor plug domain-containing protein n=1 Tax=Paraprevotella clara TaxID=454154 RepID=UPI00402609BE
MRNDTLLKDGTKKREKQDFLQEAQKPCKALGLPDSVDMMGVYRSPYISLQQNLKGQVPGLYIQEPSGEPGTQQAMFLRGTSVPLFSKVDAMSTQPAVYVNGVPIIENRAYSYSIKNNDVNPLGTATNLLAGLHLANIESIEVIKDPYELAKLGPLAANGAIWIVTRDGYRGGPNVTVDASLTASMASNGDVRMTNANDERNFRAGFYPEGTDLDRYLPAYLKDRTDPMFFGVPGWAEDYYNTPQLQYNVNASVAGGKGIANYLFAIGTATNEGMADNTDYSKYNIDFYLNMMPVKGLTVSTILQATKVSRSRNNTLRDRYAEMEYFPSMS